MSPQAAGERLRKSCQGAAAKLPVTALRSDWKLCASQKNLQAEVNFVINLFDLWQVCLSVAVRTSIRLLYCLKLLITTHTMFGWVGPCSLSGALHGQHTSQDSEWCDSHCCWCFPKPITWFKTIVLQFVYFNAHEMNTVETEKTFSMWQRKTKKIQTLNVISSLCCRMFSQML